MSTNGLTIGGWIFMLGSCGAMVVWTAWCYYLVLTTPSATEHMHSPLDIDTKDLDT
jgi:hypothetical protein